MEQKDSRFKDFVSKHRKALISLVLCVAVAAVFIPTFYKSQVNELNQDIESLTNNEDILDTDDENEVADVQDEETEDVTDETENASGELGSAESAVTVAPSENTSQGQSSGSNSGSGHGGSSGAGQTDPGSGSGSGSGSSGSGNSGSDDPGSGNPSTPQEPEQWTCYLEVECHTILNNMENLTEGKEHLVPSNGIIYSSNVKFTPGQSAYDVLRSAMQAAGIQMDAEYNSLYDSAYIRGINNLYEFDCGPYSGWMYSVNGYYPNYGTSVYTLADGDKLVFSYTCDLGRDL
ncbi:MAG: DUF4430 domain-containing protein [Firmicutes bacterium]|nr:DUF4430 domain-containing protein [Bacillota bacterium]